MSNTEMYVTVKIHFMEEERFPFPPGGIAGIDKQTGWTQDATQGQSYFMTRRFTANQFVLC
jgi:hypothetical protein